MTQTTICESWLRELHTLSDALQPQLVERLRERLGLADKATKRVR